MSWARLSPAVYIDPKNSMSFISVLVGKRGEGGTKMGHRLNYKAFVYQSQWDLDQAENFMHCFS